MNLARSFTHYLSVALLFLWGGVMLYFYASGRIINYLPPDGIFQPMVLAGGVGLIILGLFNLLTVNAAEQDCGHDQSHDHDHTADPFPGACPWHGDCLEGLASGPAMQQRWGKAGADLPPEHPAWNLEATYLASACASLACTLSPHAILLGGGVLDHPGLIDRVREKALALLNGYLPEPRITIPGLGNRAGLCGALALGLARAAG